MTLLKQAHLQVFYALNMKQVLTSTFIPFFNLKYYHKNNKPLVVIICLETILLLKSSCILQSEAISRAFTEPDSLGLLV